MLRLMLCWVMLHQLMLQDSLDLDFGWVLCGSLTGARAHLQCGLSCPVLALATLGCWML